MYLKSVEIQGFKSFADKIYLDFNPGITAIVGPNGSGKSNISDAIRWVMGEQSAKTLRGSRMEDVIFAGTEVRKPQGFAEVSLTIDNSQKVFDLDYEEVTVTRRVYRSGDSEYQINKVPCRLKDIHELFMDTGLGREGYSIVGQGKIDEILSNKSEDRRHIFEEAAGITKYKYRKNEAERKLERTNENLVRVRDIMTELESQLEPLRNQSEKAKKYLNLREQLKVVEVNVSVASIDRMKAELEETELKLESVNESIDTLQTEADKADSRTAELYEKIAEYEEYIEKCRETQKNSSEEASEETNRISLLNSDIEHFKENIERIKGEEQKSRNGAKQLDELLAELESKLAEFKAESARIDDETKKAEADFEHTNEIFENKHSEIEELKSEIIEKSSAINNLKNKIVNYSILIENFKAGYDSAKAGLAEKSGDFEQLSANNKKLESVMNRLVQEMEAMKSDASETEISYRRLLEEKSGLEQKKNGVLENINRKNSRRSVLEDMENEFEGYNRAVKSVMTAAKSGKLSDCKIYGPLSALVSTDKRYVTAIETALASVSQNIVTSNEQDAKRAIEYLKSTMSGRATFMPVSTMKARSADVGAAKNMKGYIAPADQLVSYDPLYEGVVKNVLGATVVADNIDNAIAMAAKCQHKFRIVTLSGDVMQAGGAMSGGSNGKNSGFLSRAAEIEELKVNVEKLKAEFSHIEETLKENLKISEQTRLVVEEKRQLIASKNEELIKAKADFEHSNQYLEDFTKERKNLLDEIASIENRISEINLDIETSNGEIEKLEAEIEEMQSRVEVGQDENEGILKKVRDVQDILLELSIKKNANDKDVEVQSERIAQVESEKTLVMQEITLKAAELADFESRIEQTAREIEERTKKRDSLLVSSKDVTLEIEEFSRKRKEADNQIRELQDGIKDVREKLFALGQQKARMEAQRAKTEQDLDGIFTQLWDEYELTYTEAVKIRTQVDVDIRAASKEISELRGKIKALGNINIDAIEEYASVKERFEFLTAQTNDLEKAKGELEGVIDEIMGIMKKQFAAQFETISKNFNNVFRELFGGGQANLHLTDPSDLLESGIEIEAQPPGKKLQSLTLLSGGERAFTAIALLFAILKVRPTPFCILDEIEAALDDVNVYRYADYLKKYSNKTQFIVVTHRRGTMEAANILYGVTMQERGISKLLSLRIDEVTE